MKKYVPLILILTLGTILRLYHNTLISLWHDEAFSALMIRYPWTEMFYRLGLDVHPPAYYVFLRLWHYIFGDSLLSLRSFSVFFGVASIWAGWLFAKEAFKSQKAALWAALLIALNPFQLLYVTEARMYTFGAFFVLLAGFLLVKALNLQTELQVIGKGGMPNLPQSHSKSKLMKWSYVGFTLCMIVMVYTHYYLFFTAAALGFYGLVYLYFHKGTFKKYIPLLLSFLAVVLSFLPWLKVFLFQLKQVGAGYWIPPMTIWSIPGTLWSVLLGLSRNMLAGNDNYWFLGVTVLTILIFYRFLKKTNSFHKWLCLLTVLAPFLGSMLFAVLATLKGSSSSVYLDRYFLFASMYFSVILAMWLIDLRPKWLSVSLFLVYVALNLTAYTHYWNTADVLSRPGMSGAAKFLRANVEPGHHVFVATAFEFFNYKYYAKTGFDIPTEPLLYTGGRSLASQMSHVEGVSMLADSDLLPDFSKMKSGDTVWMIWTFAFGATKPDLPLNWTEVDEKEYPDIRPYLGTSVYVSEYKVN